MRFTPVGRFVWHDLLTPDPDSAVAFYAAIAGWGTQTWRAQGREPYRMWTLGTTPFGGVMKLPPHLAGAPPHWISYVYVDDVLRCTERTKTLGGRVLHPPEEIPTVGRLAVIADPQGAALSVLASTRVPPARNGPAAVGEFSWHELATTDAHSALWFYGALFGWERDPTYDMGQLGVYHIIARQGSQIGGAYDMPAGTSTRSNWLPYIRVASAPTTTEQIRSLGGAVVMGPHEMPGGDLIAMAVDPQGASFAIHEVRRS